MERRTVGRRKGDDVGVGGDGDGTRGELGLRRDGMLRVSSGEGRGVAVGAGALLGGEFGRVEHVGELRDREGVDVEGGEVDGGFDVVIQRGVDADEDDEFAEVLDGDVV
jgi:hypothetical protein